MRNDWKYSTIGECCNINYGTRVVRKRDGGSIYDVYGGGGATFKMDTYNREDCLVVSRFAMSPKCTRFVSGKFFLNDSGLTLSPKEDSGLSEVFMNTILLANNDNIYEYGRGSAQRNLKVDEFCTMPIAYPKSLSEQERIVSILDTQFAKIDALKANAASQLQAAKDLFQSALKQLLAPQKGWEMKTLGDIAEKTADGPFGSNLKAEHYTKEKQVRIIQLSNIGEDGWRDENTKYTTFEHLLSISRSEVFPGNIVIAKMMPAGRAILCPDTEKRYVLSSDAVKIELKKGLYSKYILYYINSEHFNKQVLENVSGSGRIRTSLTKLRACKLRIPSLEEQERIAARLDTISEKVKALQANYDQTINLCNDLKQSLLKSIFA